MTRFIARWISYHPVWILASLGAITIFFGLFAPGIEFFSDLYGMLPQDDPVVQRFEETKEDFGSQSIVLIAMTAPDGETIFSLPTLRKLYTITEELEVLENEGLLEDVISATNVDTVQGTDVALIVGPILSTLPETEEDAAEFKRQVLAERQLLGSIVLEDGSAAALILKVHPDIEGDQIKIDGVMKRVNAILAHHEGPEEFYVTGDTPLIFYTNLYMRQDLGFLFPIASLVVMVVLFISFRKWHGVMLPLAVVLLAVTWTIGLMALVGVKLTVMSAFLPILLVAVGSAYGIHVINDYFERLAQTTRSRRALIVQVVEEMASPVFIAAFTTAVGFLTLLFAFLEPIREFGLFVAAGVTFSFIISLTLIPAVLSLIPLSKKGKRRNVKGSPFEWCAGRLAHAIDKRRIVVAVIAVIFLGLFLAALPGLTVETDISKYFRQDSPVIVGMDFVEENFGGSLQMSIVVETEHRDGLKDPEVLGFMDALEGYMGALGVVGDPSSLVDLVKETNYALHGDDETYYAIPDSARAIAQVLLLFEMGGGDVLESMVNHDFSQAQITAPVRSVGTAELQELLKRVQNYIDETIPSGVSTYITGMPSVYVRVSQKLVQSQLSSLVVGLVGVGIVVALLMGSVVAGLIAMVPLVLSVVGNFGTMAITGANLDMATVMIASMVIGIGVDYSVHFISRYRRERVQGTPHREALFATYNTAGRAIVYNALTLTFGFLVLTISNFGAFQTLGWLVALTMVSSALGALLIVPVILGIANPKFLTRSAGVVWRPEKGRFPLSWQTSKTGSITLSKEHTK